jgi:hypothetical protein
VAERLARVRVAPEARRRAEALLKSNDPQALWYLADMREPVAQDSPVAAGEELSAALLLDQNWEGYFNLKDPVQRGRFDDYVAAARRRPRMEDLFFRDKNGNKVGSEFVDEMLEIDPKADRGHRIASMQHAIRLGIDPQGALEMYGLDKEPPTPEELAEWPAWDDKEAWRRLAETHERFAFFRKMPGWKTW